jgi:DASS family divalent anion:Na+ symporter
MKASFQGTIITGAMFLTGMVTNSLVAKMAGDLGVEITWTNWALAALVPGCFSLILIPLLLYVIYPPEIKETPGARTLARAELEQIGPMKRSEWILLGVLLGLLVFWILGPTLQLSSTATALGGLAALLITGVLTWQDVCREHRAWNTLVWVGAIVTMATFLNEFGLITWFSETVSQMLGGSNWIVTFVSLSLIYFYSHYFFASNTAHVGSMYVPFLAVTIAAGTPPLLAALVLGFFSNLFSSMTHYGTGPSPIYYGSGYVELGDWWKLGALISVVNILIWLGIGGVWWKVIGIW